MQKLLTFFQQKFQHICVSFDVNFNESLTNDVVSFEQLGPGILKFCYPVVYSADRSRAVVPVSILLFVALWFIILGSLFKFCLVLFCSCVFQSFEQALRVV